MHFDQSTKGRARTIVATCGDCKALDAWRQLADHGCSLRPQNLYVLLQKVLYPKKDVSNKELEKSIADWETDVEVHARATSHTGEEVMAASVQKMLLLQMCSPALRSHLRMRDHLLPDYGAIRQEIADWLSEEASRAPKGKAIGAVEAPAEDVEQE